MDKNLQPDSAELLVKIYEQLIALEKKIDTIMARPKRPSSPARRFGKFIHQDEKRIGMDRGGVDLHKAICADCNKACEVPFRPSQDRPIYCRECFAKHKASGAHTSKKDNGPRKIRHDRGRMPERGHGGAMRRFGEKRNSYSKKRKRSRGQE